MGELFLPSGSDSCTINKLHVSFLKVGEGSRAKGEQGESGGKLLLPFLVHSNRVCVCLGHQT